MLILAYYLMFSTPNVGVSCLLGTFLLIGRQLEPRQHLNRVCFGLLMFEKLTKYLILTTICCLGISQIGAYSPVVAEEAKASSKAPERPYGYYINPICDAVKATDDQRKKILAISEELRPTIEPLKKKFVEKQAVFLSGMATGASAEDLLCAQRELGQIRGEINDQYLLMRLRVRKVLQPVQIAAYDDFIAKQGWSKKDQK